MKRTSGVWLSLYAALYVLFLYLPVLLLPVFSVNTAPTPRFPLSGVTLDWYRALPDTPALLDAAWNSLRVGFSAAALSTVLGLCVARAVTRYRFRGKRAVTAVVMAPLVLPEIIVAVSLLIVILQLGLQLSLVTVALGHAVVCLPYAVTVLITGFESFDASLEEASADLGETAWGTFRRVTLPLVTPAVVSSALVAFTLSLDEFILAFFLAGTETTLPVYIWSQLRFAGKLPGVLALGTILLIGSVLLLSAAEVFRRRAERATRSPSL